jgi:folate-binding protein YgfZ
MSIPPLSLEGIARLDHLGVIEATGADAVSFLHGQLTQDLALLDANHARLAALCNAKGRMLASFILFKDDSERVILICSRDILPSTLKRLSMFVLRAKCKLVDATERFVVLGAAGQAAVGVGHPGSEVWKRWTNAGTEWISLYPAQRQPRALGVQPVEQATPAITLDRATWALGDVLSGVATVTQPIVETFVPQMLNFESVGGVNFKKGCYPGQEVVARSQFRGTLKRRAHVCQSDALLSAGQEVFSANEPDQPVGVVAQSAPLGTGSAAIVCLQTSHIGQPLRAQSATGPSVVLEALPYPLLEDI